MKQKLHRKILIVIGILVITSVACSCGAIDSIVNQLPVDLDNIDPEQLATDIANQLPEEMDDLLEEATGGDEPLPPAAEGQVFTDLDSNMAGLENYRMEIKMTTDGQDANGNSVQESVVVFQEVNTAQSAYHLKISSESNINATESYEIFTIGSDYYIFDPNNEMGMGMSCYAMTGDTGMDDEFSPESLSPDDFFDEIEGGDLVQRGEMVNGIQTDHYRLKNVGMAGSMVTTQSGDIWIAQNGGYIVRFVGDGEGQAVMFGDSEDITGTMHWEYNLLDANNGVEIVLPDECQQAAEQGVNGLPVPDNATEKTSFGPMLTFNSPDSPDLVAEYYRTEMAALGYTLSEDTSFGGMYMYTFTMGEETVSIIITEGENGATSVVITTEEI